MKFITYFIFLSGIAILGCDPVDSKLKFVNNSNNDIYLYYSCDSALTKLEIFRNGFYKNSSGDSAYFESDVFIRREQSCSLTKIGINAWTSFINSCENETIHFYIFTDSVVTNYPDSLLAIKNMYIKHLEFSKKELRMNNWTIQFP